MDKYFEDKKNFNNNYVKITKKDYDNLTLKNKKRYDRAKDKGLIPAIKEGAELKTLKVFDPTSYTVVTDKELGIGMLKDKPSRKSTTVRYNPDIGQAVPTKKPAMSKRTDFRKGGMVISTIDNRKNR